MVSFLHTLGEARYFNRLLYPSTKKGYLIIDINRYPNMVLFHIIKIDYPLCLTAANRTSSEGLLIN